MFQACKFTLRSISPILEAEHVGNMLTEHLIDDGNLQYQDFITALSKHLVKYFFFQLFTARSITNSYVTKFCM